MVVLPEKKTNGNKENTKDKEVEPKKRRRTHPKKLKKTKEEMEMMNHGLFDNDNIPITNNEEIVSSRNYGSRLMVISEMVYQQTIVYHWEVIRGKCNSTGMEIYGRLSMVSLIIDGPEKYWCIKHYDRGSQISLAANKGIVARKMKYKAKAKEITSTGTIMKTVVIRTMRATEMTDYG